MKKYSKKAADATNKNLRTEESKGFMLLPVKELRNIQRTLVCLYANEPEPLFVNGRYLYV
jgi:hypothetical protein